MAINSLEIPDGIEQHPAQGFDFEVVTVNGLGEIVQRQTHTARQFIENLDGGVSLAMVLIPGGTFLMGSRAGQGYDDERPQHSVVVPSFLMGKYPVTQAQWEAVMGWSPPYRCKGARRPVDRVSWEDARAFCARLSARTGRAYRLASEAEWEYACRAGTTTPFYFGETITTGLANYVGEHVYRSEPKGIYRHATTEVGSFPPNAFGLYDMHGNVWQWCQDWYSKYKADAVTDPQGPARGGVRVMRGGSWGHPRGCETATRYWCGQDSRSGMVGFRIVVPASKTP